jgi:hypothetical protein
MMHDWLDQTCNSSSKHHHHHHHQFDDQPEHRSEMARGIMAESKERENKNDNVEVSRELAIEEPCRCEGTKGF